MFLVNFHFANLFPFHQFFCPRHHFILDNLLSLLHLLYFLWLLLYVCFSLSLTPAFLTLISLYSLSYFIWSHFFRPSKVFSSLHLLRGNLDQSRNQNFPLSMMSNFFSVRCQIIFVRVILQVSRIMSMNQTLPLIPTRQKVFLNLLWRANYYKIWYQRNQKNQKNQIQVFQSLINLRWCTFLDYYLSSCYWF